MVFHNLTIPEPGTLVGYGALINAFVMPLFSLRIFVNKEV